MSTSCRAVARTACAGSSGPGSATRARRRWPGTRRGSAPRSRDDAHREAETVDVAVAERAVLAAREPLGRPQHGVGVEDVIDCGAPHGRVDDRAEDHEQLLATTPSPLGRVLRWERAAGK